MSGAEFCHGLGWLLMFILISGTLFQVGDMKDIMPSLEDLALAPHALNLVLFTIVVLLTR